jgi:AraC-like DNA-binding protein
VSSLVRPPSPALAPFVASIGYFEAELQHSREARLPNGAMQLVVNLAEDELRWYDGNGARALHRVGGAGVCAALAEPVVIDTEQQRAVVCVAFKPGGAYPFFAPPASTICEPIVELDALWGREGALLRERLLGAPTPEAMLHGMETALLARSVRPLEPDTAIEFAVVALGRGATVAGVEERLGTTRGRLRRRFTERVGLTPKRFARIRRLQRLLASIPAGPTVDWARAAFEQGFSDQPHLINDFRALTGMTPGAYRPRSDAAQNHVPLAG